MERKEVIELFKVMKLYYRNLEVSTELVDAWYKILKKYDYTPILKNLEKFVETSKFYPTIADLIEGQYRELRSYDITENTYSPEIMAALAKDLEKERTRNDESIFQFRPGTSSIRNNHKEK